MKLKCLFFLYLFLCCCKHDRKINTSFYYWKTIYKHNKTEEGYLRHFHSNNLYVRIMDIDLGGGTGPVPVSAITFKDSLPAGVNIIPVVFIVNDMLKQLDTVRLKDMAKHIAEFVSAKVQQAGKQNFSELQIDCDWTATTRDHYFYLLNQLKKQPLLKGKTISATLRLHQLKNQQGSGIPPVNKVMLMCYNMGNLRRYGTQNSIVELSELKRYLGNNLKQYPLKTDIALPLFSWAVAFRQKQYIGISKRIGLDSLNNKGSFAGTGNGLYRAITDLPQFGLKQNDEVRWEAADTARLENISKYLSQFIAADTLNITYFHMDENLLKTYPYACLETISNLLR